MINKNNIVLSFDVGIIHLSYCLLKKNDNNSWEILEWNNIDLTSQNIEKCYIQDCNSKSFYTNIINCIDIFITINTWKSKKTI